MHTTVKARAGASLSGHQRTHCRAPHRQPCMGSVEEVQSTAGVLHLGVLLAVGILSDPT